MPISSAFYTREIDLTTAHDNFEVTVGPFYWVQFFCDGGVNGIKVAVGTQNTNVINLNEFRTIPVVAGQKVYITNDVRSGRSRLLMVFSRTAPLESYQGGDPVNNAELAARLGSIQTFDRRGEVIFADDFESGLGKWTISTQGTGASVVPGSTYVKSGSVSAKMVTGSSINDYAQIDKYLSYYAIGKYGVEISFLIADTNVTYDLELLRYDGTNYYRAGIRLNTSTAKLQYLNSSGSYVDLATGLNPFPTITAGVYSFVVMKLVVDITNNRYSRAVYNNNQFANLSHPLISGELADPISLKMLFKATTLAAANKTSYAENAIVTQNEP